MYERRSPVFYLSLTLSYEERELEWDFKASLLAGERFGERSFNKLYDFPNILLDKG